MSVRLDGRVAIVTGAGSGLGRAHALMLAERGAHVVVNDPGRALDGSGESHSAADRVVAEIEARGGSALPNYGSVTDPASAQQLVAAAIERFGRLDVLVNNAGILRDKTFSKMSLEDFRAVIEVHLMGSVNCTWAAWPHMRERRYGRIVMTSSGAGLFGNFGQSNYGAAKMGLIGLMNVLKLEGTRDGILVNAVSPIAATRMTEAHTAAAVLPHLRPECVSAAVVYLASEECRVTGYVLSAGAGYLSRTQVMEAEGMCFDPATVSPDTVGSHFDAITDLSRPAVLGSAPEFVERATRRFAAPGA